jgi:hypothetical protein
MNKYDSNDYDSYNIVCSERWFDFQRDDEIFILGKMIMVSMKYQCQMLVMKSPYTSQSCIKLYPHYQPVVPQQTIILQQIYKVGNE